MKKIPMPGGRVAIIDDCDFEKVSGFSWHLHSAGYACAWVVGRPNQRKALLHRFILDYPSEHVDHRNGNRLDCRRSNLRTATIGQNNANRRAKIPGFKGVYHSPRNLRKPWRARIQFDGKVHWLGWFATADEAARAYDAKQKELFGEFARLNFPEEDV